MFLISQRVTLINPLGNILMRAFIAEPVDNIIVLVVLMRNHLLKISGNSEDDASEILEKKCFLITKWSMTV